MRILFIRHGKTEVNAKSSTHRRGDEAGLDEIGAQQARKVAVVCRREHVTTVYSSSERRAVQTASLICEALDLKKPLELQELGERDWGDWAGRPWSDIEAKLEPMTLDERYEFVPPNGESWAQMNERYAAGLQKVLKDSADAVAVVGHAGAMRALMPILKGEPKETSFRYDFKNASVTIFDYQAGKWFQVSEDDTSQLS
jgi:alpha-ribazole phosphatase